ncbi:MAG: MFS transporter [Planctomycetes bacterium]|nr:MFS transporter [Planctomycetota bacterium]
MTFEPEAGTSPAELPKWTALRTVGLGTFMGSLDTGIMHVVNPTLQQALDRPLGTIQWVSTAYLVALGGLLLAGGSLADLVGRRLPYTLGFAIFTVGSALCGLAVTAEQLIAFRVVQGIGAALLFSSGPAILTQAFPATERGKALGLVGSVVGLGVLLGPPLGGFLCDRVGWRSIFYLNVPIGIVGSIHAWRVLRASAPGTGRWRDFDLSGALCLGAGLVLLLLGLDAAGSRLAAVHATSSGPMSAALAASALLLAAFPFVEARARTPLLRLGLFRSRAFTLAAASTLLAYVAVFAVLFLVPNFLRTLLRATDARIGLLLALLPLAMGGLTPVAGALSDRIGSRLLSSLGMALATCTLLFLAGLGTGTGSAPFGAAFTALGVAMALFQPATSSALLGTVPREHLGVAAGTLATLRSLGMALGIALPVAIFGASFARLCPGVNPTEAAGGGAHPIEFLAAWRTTFLAIAAVSAVGIATSACGGARTGPSKVGSAVEVGAGTRTGGEAGADVGGEPGGAT